jgi:hypothetical protein
MVRKAAHVRTHRFTHLLAAAALLVASATLAAQSKPVLITDLKVGDWAEVPNGYPPQWVPVTIAGPYDRGTYKINQNGIVVSVSAYSTYIRHRTPTAADLATQQGSAAAMRSRPTGPVGGKFGSREPAGCPDRKAPPSAANAKQYFVCDWEANLHPLEIDLAGDVAIDSPARVPSTTARTATSPASMSAPLSMTPAASSPLTSAPRIRPS